MNNNIVRFAVAAAVVVLAVFLGTRFIGPNVGTGPEPTATPSPSQAAPSASAAATPLPRLNGQDPLDLGRYQVNAGLSTDVTVAVPAGWSAGGDWLVAGPVTDPDNGITIRFYTIPNLAANPLSRAAGNLDPPVGPTVEGLVQAIVAHPAWTATEPTDITIDGRAGRLVTIMIPLDAPLPADGDGEFYLYVSADGGGIYGWLPGQTFDLYIVDVDGERLIIDSFHYPGASQADLAAQRAVVESVQFGSNP